MQANNASLLNALYSSQLTSFAGLIRQPKYGHLKELHRAVHLCENALVSTDPTVTSLGGLQEVLLLIIILYSLQ